MLWLWLSTFFFSLYFGRQIQKRQWVSSSILIFEPCLVLNKEKNCLSKFLKSQIINFWWEALFHFLKLKGLLRYIIKPLAVFLIIFVNGLGWELGIIVGGIDLLLNFGKKYIWNVCRDRIIWYCAGLESLFPPGYLGSNPSLGALLMVLFEKIIDLVVI